MSKATLVIMAAGIGSRFGGGIKQLAPIGPNGEIIMDYSIYDALEAGFDKVVFVIRKDLEKDFKEIIGNRIEKEVEVAYAFQELDRIRMTYWIYLWIFRKNSAENSQEEQNLGEQVRQFFAVKMWWMLHSL